MNGADVTIPANQPVVGNSLGWFNGRIYSPSFVQTGEHDGVMTFTGYHTPRPNDDRGDTRGIGSVRLHSSENIVAISNGDDRDDRNDATMIAAKKKTKTTTNNNSWRPLNATGSPTRPRPFCSKRLDACEPHGAILAILAIFPGFSDSVSRYHPIFTRLNSTTSSGHSGQLCFQHTIRSHPLAVVTVL